MWRQTLEESVFWCDFTKIGMETLAEDVFQMLNAENEWLHATPG